MSTAGPDRAHEGHYLVYVGATSMLHAVPPRRRCARRSVMRLVDIHAHFRRQKGRPATERTRGCFYRLNDKKKFIRHTYLHSTPSAAIARRALPSPHPLGVSLGLGACRSCPGTSSRCCRGAAAASRRSGCRARAQRWRTLAAGPVRSRSSPTGCTGPRTSCCRSHRPSRT